MQIYHYDQVTGELFGEGVAARVCPGREAWDDATNGKYLIPAEATPIAPPDSVSGYARVFSGGVWEQVEDHRGENWFNDNGAPITIVTLGPIPEGFTAEAPYVAPAPITAVTPRQIRLALNQAGLRDAVEAYVASASKNVKDTWEFATTIERDNPIIATAAPSLNITDAQLDELFTLAGTL